MEPLALAHARDDERARAWLRTHYVDYLRDLIAAGAEYVLTENGPEPDYLPYWLEQSFCLPLVAYQGDVATGFVLAAVRPFPYMDEESDSHIGEFYIAPAHRERGAGDALFRAAAPFLAGTCELSVLHANARALAFWRATLRKHARDVREDAGSDAITFRFRVNDQS